MSTNDVEPVLLSIVEKGSVLQFNDYVNTVNYDVILRTKLSEGETPPQQCDNWVAKFSAVTNSHWIVKNTSPYAVRVLYKKSYTCKNKKCNAKINIVFKKNNRNTRKNDPLLAQGLTAVVKIIFKHNHEIYCPALSLSSNTKVETKYSNDDKLNSSFKYHETSPPSPEMIKCEDSVQDFAMDSRPASDESDTDCKDTSETLNLIADLPLDCSDISAEISKFKHEIKRIVGLIEETKSNEVTQCVKNLNHVLEMINTPQHFCASFSKILE